MKHITFLSLLFWLLLSTSCTKDAVSSNFEMDATEPIYQSYDKVLIAIDNEKNNPPPDFTEPGDEMVFFLWEGHAKKPERGLELHQAEPLQSSIYFGEGPQLHSELLLDYKDENRPPDHRVVRLKIDDTIILMKDEGSLIDGKMQIIGTGGSNTLRTAYGTLNKKLYFNSFDLENFRSHGKTAVIYGWIAIHNESKIHA